MVHTTGAVEGIYGVTVDLRQPFSFPCAPIWCLRPCSASTLSVSGFQLQKFPESPGTHLIPGCIAPCQLFVHLLSPGVTRPRLIQMIPVHGLESFWLKQHPLG